MHQCRMLKRNGESNREKHMRVRFAASWMVCLVTIVSMAGCRKAPDSPANDDERAGATLVRQALCSSESSDEWATRWGVTCREVARLSGAYSENDCRTGSTPPPMPYQKLGTEFDMALWELVAEKAGVDGDITGRSQPARQLIKEHGASPRRLVSMQDFIVLTRYALDAANLRNVTPTPSLIENLAILKLSQRFTSVTGSAAMYVCDQQSCARCEPGNATK
jgi:hypothetical protein